MPSAPGNATAPAGNATAPAGNATAPAGNATAPAGNATAPAGNATAPAGNATAPAGNASAPGGNATAPGGKAPGGNGTGNATAPAAASGATAAAGGNATAPAWAPALAAFPHPGLDTVNLLAGGLAAAAGALLGPTAAIFPHIGEWAVLKAFIVVVMGGLGSMGGAVVGGLALGVVEALGANYISIAFKDAIGYGIIILVLLWRPAGLFVRAR